jgi:hypothetical protein
MSDQVPDLRPRSTKVWIVVGILLLVGFFGLRVYRWLLARGDDVLAPPPPPTPVARTAPAWRGLDEVEAVFDPPLPEPWRQVPAQGPVRAFSHPSGTTIRVTTVHVEDVDALDKAWLDTLPAGAKLEHGTKVVLDGREIAWRSTESCGNTPYYLVATLVPAPGQDMEMSDAFLLLNTLACRRAP